MKNSYRFFIVLGFFTVPSLCLFSQVGINTDNSAPDPTAMLDVKSSSRGFLVPRMTITERNAISSPATGLLVFCIGENQYYCNKGTPSIPNWVMISSQWVTMGSDIFFTGGRVGLGTENPAYPLHVAGDINFTGTLRKNGLPVVSGVSTVTANLPLSSTGGSSPTISISQAGTLLNGFLSSDDWNIFNDKQNALNFGNVSSGDIAITGGNGAVIGNGMNMTINKGNLSSSDMTITGSSGSVLGSGTSLTINKGNLIESTSAVLTISGGTGSVLGSGISLQVKQAGVSQSGYLSNSDWNTFNNKQSTLTFGDITSSDISVSGGIGAVKGTGVSLTINKGNLTSADITITDGSGSVLGTGTDLVINKGNVTSPDMTITGGSSSVLGAGTSLTINKGNLTESGSSVLTITNGGNSVLGTGTAIQANQANITQSGYLSSTDWNIFNDKVSSQWTANGLRLHYNTGNVGIGTTDPQSKIDIAGNAVIGASYSGTSAAPANGLLVEGRIGVGTSVPAPSASIEVSSTTTGVLLPRMTYDQRNAIANPAEGLMIFCTDCGSNGTLSVYSNGAWRTFSPCTSPVPGTTTNTITFGQIIWNWIATPGAIGYKWGTTTSYSTATDMESATSKTETGLVCDSTYTRYLWSYNACGISDLTILTETIPAIVPNVPMAAMHVSTQVSIDWFWHPVPGASGYKWGVSDDFASATDMGTDTTKTETGLTCETAYSRFVWAYNGCGYSLSAALNQSTLACWACGISTITVSHNAGAVAPVTKTTTYGTVTNIPGELTKCWITSNLGSDQQATAVSDATEASAGWYWQFNRKQGYKHDGTTRTPNTTWISSINETSDWITANDPCNIELGTTWRIPTYTEWYNVDNTGGWTTWTGPWGSGLKLHAAGYLSNSSGSLSNRGSNGDYWSSTQSDAIIGWNLLFISSNSVVNNSLKTYGFSIRCLRD